MCAIGGGALVAAPIPHLSLFVSAFVSLEQKWLKPFLDLSQRLFATMAGHVSRSLNGPLTVFVGCIYAMHSGPVACILRMSCLLSTPTFKLRLQFNVRAEFPEPLKRADCLQPFYRW